MKRELFALVNLTFMVSHDCCVTLPCRVIDLSAVCDNDYFLIMLTYYFCLFQLFIPSSSLSVMPGCVFLS